jgi:hypothetical protein
LVQAVQAEQLTRQAMLAAIPLSDRLLLLMGAAAVELAVIRAAAAAANLAREQLAVAARLMAVNLMVLL